MANDTTEAAVVADLARRSTTIATPDGRVFAIVPDGAELAEVSDEHKLKIAPPRYINQAVTLQTKESLIGYVDDFKGDATRLFADIDRNLIVAQIDYHARDKAAQIAHRASLQLSYSEEWKLWTSISGKLMGQLEFARFIEENAADVRAPDAAELIEVVRDLQANRKVNFVKAVRTATENENFEFTDETNLSSKRGEIEIPTKFKLGLPVYFGEPDTEVYAFLRWKLDKDAGGLALGIQLHRIEHVRQAVFKAIVLEIAETTARPALFGKL